MNDKTAYSKATLSSRPGGKTGCDIWGKKFGKHESFVVREIKVNWFRGDDEVEFRCAPCTPVTILKQLKFKIKEA